MGRGRRENTVEIAGEVINTMKEEEGNGVGRVNTAEKNQKGKKRIK